MKLLACNAGSTSLKFRLYNMPEEREIISGKLEKIGSDEAIVSYKYGDKKGRSVRPVKSFLEGTAIVMSILSEQGAIQSQEDISGIAHILNNLFRKGHAVLIDKDVGVCVHICVEDFKVQRGKIEFHSIIHLSYHVNFVPRQ